MMERNKDVVVEEVRAARRQVSQSCGHDANELVRHYMRLQEGYRDRLLSDEGGPEVGVTAPVVPGQDAA